MVSAAVAKLANVNSLPTSLPADFTAVFMGATSGIGRSVLAQLAEASQTLRPRIYVVGRSADAAAQQMADLCETNPSATVEFIEKDVSLVKAVDEVAAMIKQRESKVDLLFMSMGFLPFQGRTDTSEGLEPSMTTRYYSRIRAVQQLLPLLDASPNPHVTNILGGGEEAPLLLDDLDLARPANFSFIQASKHSATMLTLALERFASAHPRVSFVHAFPGLVATDTLKRGSSGLVGLLLKCVVSPLVNTFVAQSVVDAGAKGLLYATNARYTVQDTDGLAAQMPEGLERVKQTDAGLFLVGQNGEATGNEKLLGELRREASDAVWQHTEDIFERVTR